MTPANVGTAGAGRTESADGASPAVGPEPTRNTAKHPALGPFHDRREMVLGTLLAAVAGATGAAAWLYTSGWYVTFMTGNSERMVLELFTGKPGVALAAGATVLCFVLGVMAGMFARLRLWTKARHGATVVTAGATVAACACDLVLVSDGRVIGAVPVLCLAFGLGALNTSFSRRGEGVMPMSYMHGTLVKIGQGLSMHLAGIGRWRWVAQLVTYLGFLAGAGLGGLAFSSSGAHNALILLALGAVAVTLVTWRLDHSGFLERDQH